MKEKNISKNRTQVSCITKNAACLTDNLEHSSANTIAIYIAETGRMQGKQIEKLELWLR